MPWKKENAEIMLRQIDAIIEHAFALEEHYRPQLERVHPKFKESARNLVHYRAMRSNDIRELQKQLGHMGISRLAKAESHTMANLSITRSILLAFLHDRPLQIQLQGVSIMEGNRLIRSNAKALLGFRSKGRRTRIMVTLPSEAADDYKLVRDMIAAGMNCARINCAHDGPEQWKKMVDNIRRASDKLKRKCKISMDLGGPKIRTGQVRPGPKVFKYRPEKDIRRRVVQPIEVWIGAEPPPGMEILYVPAVGLDLKNLKAGDKLYFNDARFKRREFLLTSVAADGCRAECFRTAVLETGLPIYLDKARERLAFTVGELPPIEGAIPLKKGDSLVLHQALIPGEPAQVDKKGKLLREAHISCTSEEVFAQLQPGDPILFDDGMIEGVVWEVRPDEALIRIKHTRQGGARLRADKGINLPASQLTIRGLTAKDQKDLQFVAQYADVVNMSFVNSAQDVRDLIAELERLGVADKLGIILKIETQSGFNNLLEILLEAMRVHPVGVMIARGDLAIECGWDNIGRVQEEILSLCQSAHIPDIWATQVLENMAKRGIPSRAEITDAAMAQRAECVMLNKGDFILPAIQLLGSILKDMEPYQEKNAPMLPAMELADAHRISKAR
jgi:pyruvate kinase